MNFSLFKAPYVKKSTSIDHKDAFLSKFKSSELHQWIFEDIEISRNIMYFLENLPNEVFVFFNNGPSLSLLYSSGSYSCAIPRLQDHHTILIFPETVRMLTESSIGHAYAILAHEIGHICLDHSKRCMSSIEKQFEADEFSAKIGYKNELINFLENQEEMHLEIKMRLKELYSSKALADQ